MITAQARSDNDLPDDEFQGRFASPAERAFYQICERDFQIAELKTQIARLSAAPSIEEMRLLYNAAWQGQYPLETAIIAFLKRRMKG